MSRPDRDEVIRRLREHEPEIRGAGVRSLALFGSVRRGGAGPDSDVDLLVEFERTPGLLGFIEIGRRLAEIVGSPVDLVPRDSLRPRFRDEILREAEVVVAA